jgi:Ca2+-dependent lipid-binding protein
VAVVVSRFIGIFRLGWGWTLILLASCATYYDVSITRVRRAAKDDIQRELVKTRLIVSGLLLLLFAHVRRLG